MKISSNRICKRIKIVCLFHPGKLHSFKNSSYNQTMIIGVGICTYFIALGHGFPSQQYRVHWLSSGVHIILIFTSFLGTSRSNQTVRKLYLDLGWLLQGCNKDFSKILGEGHWCWIHDFVVIFGVNNRPIYMALCS